MLAALVLLGAMASLAACNKKTNITDNSSQSIVRVASPAAGPLIVSTPSAEFRLYPNGYLKASLLRDGKALTLDDGAGPGPGNSVAQGNKELSDFSFDLDHAKISEASGRLGPLGKQIQVSGKSASSADIQSTLILEVYDSFPNVLLSSVSFKNSGNSELSVGKVVIQRHLLNASLSDPNAAP